MEVGFNEKREMRLRQKNFLAVNNHHLTTDNFIEICKNFI
jgi:hypothetical protein